MLAIWNLYLSLSISKSGLRSFLFQRDIDIAVFLICLNVKILEYESEPTIENFTRG